MVSNIFSTSTAYAICLLGAVSLDFFSIAEIIMQKKIPAVVISPLRQSKTSIYIVNTMIVINSPKVRINDINNSMGF